MRLNVGGFPHNRFVAFVKSHHHPSFLLLQDGHRTARFGFPGLRRHH